MDAEESSSACDGCPDYAQVSDRLWLWHMPGQGSPGQQSEQVLPQALVSVAVKLQHAAVVHICGAGGKGEAGGE